MCLPRRMVEAVIGSTVENLKPWIGSTTREHEPVGQGAHRDHGRLASRVACARPVPLSAGDTAAPETFGDGVTSGRQNTWARIDGGDPATRVKGRDCRQSLPTPPPDLSAAAWVGMSTDLPRRHRVELDHTARVKHGRRGTASTLATTELRIRGRGTARRQPTSRTRRPLPRRRRVHRTAPRQLWAEPRSPWAHDGRAFGHGTFEARARRHSGSPHDRAPQTGGCSRCCSPTWPGPPRKRRRWPPRSGALQRGDRVVIFEMLPCVLRQLSPGA